jgi:6-pyruvoyltetrahydropterin/6-carboxytetrahydropterin synthase
MTHTAERYHDISTGHRVVGHENKCRHLHGHNYRIHFVCRAQPEKVDGWGDPTDDNTHDNGLDHIGRVIDFGVIKEKLCMWVENNWDHKFLAWENDPVMLAVVTALDETHRNDSLEITEGSIVWTPFNPTAENMAQYLVEVVGPQQLEGTGVELVSCTIEETAKCSASFYKD